MMTIQRLIVQKHRRNSAVCTIATHCVSVESSSADTAACRNLCKKIIYLNISKASTCF